MKENPNSLEVLYDYKDIIDEDNRYEVESNEFKIPTVIRTNKKSNNFPFIFYIFILSLIGLICFIIYYLIRFFNSKNKVFYVSLVDPFLKPKVTKYKYKNIKFINGLELLLVQVDANDKAGGSIVINNGYNDNIFEKGELKLYLYSLINKTLHDNYTLSDYYGNINYRVNDFYSYFRFDILNDGFFNYLKNFSTLLDLNPTTGEQFMKNYENSRQKLDREYRAELKELDKKEQFLIDYLVYGFNENGSEVYRPGKGDYFPAYKNSSEILKKIEILKNNMLNLLRKLIKPSKIKIVLMSHFKMSRMEAKFKRYFKYLINLKESEQSNFTEDYEYNVTNFTKQKVIVYKIGENEKSYIKINYYIDKMENESYSDFIISAGYFNYLKYMLDVNKETLNERLDENKFDFKSFSTDFEIILKKKIKFSIKIESYRKNYHFQDILYSIYHYIYKIVKFVETISKDDERYKEIKKILDQNFTFREDSDNPMETSYNLALNLFQKTSDKNHFSYFLKNNWIPPIDNDIDIDKLKKYYKQLIPDNSIIIFGVNGKEGYNETCKSEHNFILDCSQLLLNNKNYTKTLKFFNLRYAINDLNVNFTEHFKKDEESSITFKKNEYISDYEDLITEDPEDENNDNLAVRIGNESNMRYFYFKKDTTFKIPKVHVTLNFFHPYLRPGNFAEDNLLDINTNTKKQIKFYLIMLYWTYIKKEIQKNLNDAVVAGNDILVSYNDNNLIIQVFAYTDKIEKILNEIKNIIMNTKDLENDKFKNKAELYNESLFEDFLNFEDTNYSTITRFYFKNFLANGKMYNKYKFVKEFNDSIYDYSINEISNVFFGKFITSFIIDSHIYGDCNEERAIIIVDIFKENKEDEKNFNKTLSLAGYNTEKDEINIYNFISATRNISQLSNRSNMCEDEILSNKRNNKTLIRYFYYKDYNLPNYLMFSLLSKMLSSDKGKSKFSSFELETVGFLRNATYFQFIMTKKSNAKSEDFNKLKYLVNSTLLAKNRTYIEDIDVVGDRFYYLKRNLANALFKRRDNFNEKAIYYLNSLKYSHYKEKSIKYELEKIELNKLITDFNDTIDKNPKLDFLH